MAKSKAELENDRTQHDALMRSAQHARREGQYQRAIELAVSAWHHIDGKLQYERRYEGVTEYEFIDSISLVVSYSPVLFDYEHLDQLATLLKAQRRIEKAIVADVGQNLTESRALMANAHRMWNHIELSGEVRQDELRAILGGDQDIWRSIAETWEHIGVIKRTRDRGTYLLSLRTRLDDVVSAKCSSCGTVDETAKCDFLDVRQCPSCGNSVHFVLLSQIAD